MKKAKIVLIGAGSRSFAPGVIRDIVLEDALAAGVDVEMLLVDLNADVLRERLDYANRCAAFKKSKARFSTAANREEALKGADFVIISVAVRRDALWEQDVRVGQACGFDHVLGECGGPAAAFHALRNYELVMPICRDIERICPEALVMNFTNPEARILTAILTQTRLRAIGLCHGWGGFHWLVETVLGRSTAGLDIRTAGMNHFFTYYRIADSATGEDLIPAFRDAFRARLNEWDPTTRYLFERFDVVGYPHGSHTGEYIAGSGELEGCGWDYRPLAIEHRRLSAAETPSEDAIHHAAIIDGTKPVDEKHVKPSGEQAVSIIADLALGRAAWRHAVNVLNTGRYIPNLAEDGCIEVPMTVSGGVITPETVPALPEGFAAHIRLQHSIQKLLARSYVEKSKHLLLQALLLDPVVRSPAAAVKFMDWMFDIQRDYLPAYH